MRYDKYNPQLSPYSGGSKRRRRRVAGCLRTFIMAMTVLIVAVSCVLFWQLFLEERIQPVSSYFTKKTAATTTETTISTVTPVPTSLPEIEELLPFSEIVENYFGPLPTPEFRSELTRREVRALYAGTADKLDSNIALAENSEINALVVDLKESYGIPFNSQNPLALSIGEVAPEYNLSSVIEKCHAKDIWVIGRIVCFKDPGLASAHPELSIQDEEGNALRFTLEGDLKFANPYNPEVWDYYIDLAIEAIEMGVDEIQFDYVRFPTGNTQSGNAPFYGPEETTPKKSEAINRFLQTARIRIQDTCGVPVSADVFAIVLTNGIDREIIGQDWPTIGLTGIDSVCPMIYHDLYARGFILNNRVYESPDLYPYDIIYNALLVGSQNAPAEGYSVIRPYLKAYTASWLGNGRYLNYGHEEINAQIRALEDAGYSEYVLWNANNEYPEGTYHGN